MIYYAYILKSNKTNRFYIGSCQNIKTRLDQHNQGKTKSTKSGVPWLLQLYEEFDNRREACKRERQIKSYKGGRAFKKLIDKSNTHGEVA